MSRPTPYPGPVALSVTTPRFPIVAFLERRTRRQWIVAGTLVTLFAAWWIMRAFAWVQLDRWWFDGVGQTATWRTQWTAKVALTLIAGAVTLLAVFTTLALVARTGRRLIAEPNRLLRWYHARMGPAHGWLLVAIGAWVIISAGRGALRQWPAWLLWRNGRDLGVPVAGTGGDLGDYLFDLPMALTASSFVRQLLAVCAVLAVFGHTMSGALRWSPKVRSRRLASAHVAALVGLWLLAEIVDLLLVRPKALALDTSGGFVGSGYALTNFTRPGLVISAIAAAVALGVLVWSVVSRRWRPAAGATAAWIAVHLVVVVVLPTLVNRVVVRPAIGARELPALGRHLNATREAFGLAAIPTVAETVGADPRLAASAGGLPPLVLFDPALLAGPFQIMQGTTATRIVDVDLDRLDIDGVPTPVFVANRQPDRRGLPESGWVPEHFVFTHGDGVVYAPADRVDQDGRPDLSRTLVPGTLDRNTYFGEGMDGWWVVVGSRRAEQGGATYTGDQGIVVGDGLRKWVIAAGLGDLRLGLSAELLPTSQLLYRRGLRDRLNALAPYIAWESDPYPVVAGGHVRWIVDGYTTSSTYPASAFVGTAGLARRSDVAATTLNSMDHAVRAVVDASTGETVLYRTTDEVGKVPLLDAWASAFPTLFAPASEFPADLRDHLRYPADLFAVQTSLIGQYHVTDAEEFLNGSQRWTPSAGAPQSVDTGAGANPPLFTYAAPILDGQAGSPGGQSAWSLLRVFSAGSSAASGSVRDPLVAMAMATNDDPRQLAIGRLTPTGGRMLDSPALAQASIAADPEISRLLTLLNSNGSKVTFGPMTPLVLNGQLAWARSIVVSGVSASSVPRLNTVVVVCGGVVRAGPTLQAALAALATPAAAP